MKSFKQYITESKKNLERYLEKSITDHGMSHAGYQNSEKTSHIEYFKKRMDKRKRGISSAIKKLDKIEGRFEE